MRHPPRSYLGRSRSSRIEGAPIPGIASFHLPPCFLLHIGLAAAAIIIATCMLFVNVRLSYGGDELDPEAVKQAAKQGFDRADRDVEKEQLEKAKTEGRLTKEGTERLKKIDDLNKDYENWKKNPFSDKKGVDVAERARKVRNIQYELDKSNKRPDDPTLEKEWQRERDKKFDEWKKLQEGPPKLPDPPPLPSATTSLLPTAPNPLLTPNTMPVGTEGATPALADTKPSTGGSSSGAKVPENREAAEGWSAYFSGLDLDDAFFAMIQCDEELSKAVDKWMDARSKAKEQKEKTRKAKVNAEQMKNKAKQARTAADRTDPSNVEERAAKEKEAGEAQQKAGTAAQEAAGEVQKEKAANEALQKTEKDVDPAIRKKIEDAERKAPDKPKQERVDDTPAPKPADKCPPKTQTAGEQSALPSLGTQSTALASIGPGALAIIPASQSGVMTFTPSAAVDAGASSSLKGHMTLVGTETVQKQTTTKLRLDGLNGFTHVEERGAYETPEKFHEYWQEAYGKTDFSKLTLTPGWTAWDVRPPKVTPVDAKYSFSLDKLSWRDTYSTRLNVSYGFDYVSAPLEKSSIGRRCEVTFNTNPSWIAGIGPGVDLTPFRDTYMDRGMVNGLRADWRVWYPPFAETPIIVSGQISEEGYHQVAWEGPFKQFMVYGELNPGVVVKPLLHWDPATWPSGHADPLPRFRIPFFSGEERE